MTLLDYRAFLVPMFNGSTEFEASEREQPIRLREFGTTSFNLLEVDIPQCNSLRVDHSNLPNHHTV